MNNIDKKSLPIIIGVTMSVFGLIGIVWFVAFMMRPPLNEEVGTKEVIPSSSIEAPKTTTPVPDATKPECNFTGTISNTNFKVTEKNNNQKILAYEDEICYKDLSSVVTEALQTNYERSDLIINLAPESWDFINKTLVYSVHFGGTQTLPKDIGFEYSQVLVVGIAKFSDDFLKVTLNEVYNKEGFIDGQMSFTPVKYSSLISGVDAVLFNVNFLYHDCDSEQGCKNISDYILEECKKSYTGLWYLRLNDLKLQRIDETECSQYK